MDFLLSVRPNALDVTPSIVTVKPLCGVSAGVAAVVFSVSVPVLPEMKI
jgi:hypothetical protein